MRHTVLSTIAIAFLCAFQVAPAQAQPTRVFVAAQGSDANPCTFAQPCRGFQKAHDTVAAGGEIDVLDPAGYGALTITKSISIQGHGFSGISVGASGTGITISANSGGDRVNLSGLIIDGAGAGSNFGITMLTGRYLTVENCVVRNLMNGLSFFNASGSFIATLVVSNSYFTDNSNFGMIVQAGTGGGNILASVQSVTLSHNGGFFGGGGLLVSAVNAAMNVFVRDSVATNNAAGDSLGGVGFIATGNLPARLVLVNSAASNNGSGVVANAPNATVWLAQSALATNATGYNASGGGVINSYGDNYIAANIGNTGALTPVSRE